jgi:hypothetical protein
MNPVDMHLAGTGGANVAGASDDVVSDADVNPTSSGDDEFLSAQGKYNYFCNLN